MLCTELYALVVFAKSPHSLVPRSFGFSTQTTRAYSPVRHTFYEVNYMYVRHFCFRLFGQNKGRKYVLSIEKIICSPGKALNYHADDVAWLIVPRGQVSLLYA